MVSLDIIEREIRELEARGETTYAQCERLAWLYVVRDHLLPEDSDTKRTQRLGGSEFLEACSNVSYPALMQILDEHMGAIRIVYGREYENVLNRIRALRS